MDSNHSLPPIVHAYQGNKVNLGRKLQERQEKGLAPLSAALLGVEQLPPLWTHSNGCDFVRGGRFVVKPHVPATRALTPTQVLLLQSLWVPVPTPHQFNTQPPWTPDCAAVSTLCGQHASLQLPADVAQPLRHALQQKLQLDPSSSELSINEIISSHADPKYRDWQTVIIESTHWLINPTDTGNLIAQCTGLGGSELDEECDVLLACKKDAHVYGPSLSKQDDWHTKKGTIAGTAHTQEYLMLHLGLFPVGAHAWCHVKGVQLHGQVQAQIIHRALRVLQFGPITPAHRKPPWTGYKQSLRLFTQLLAAHPLTGICRPQNLTTAEANRLAEQVGVGLSIRGHSAGSYAGMVWEEILAEFPNFIGTTVLAAVAFPPKYMTQPKRSGNRQLHLIHHAEDRLCVWNPSRADIVQLRHFEFRITYVTGWRAYLGNAQHNYAHWTKVELPEGRHDLSTLEQIPGVLPFEVYVQAPLRLISWCSFELDHRARALVRELAILCETPTTTITELVEHIGQRHSNIHTEQAATHYLAKLATVHIASRAQMPSYTTMVQQFLGTLKLPMAIYMLDYYLPMLSPNDGYNETGLTMHSAGPVREEWQPIHLSYLYQGSEFGHWKVTGGHDAFAFRHPSLAQTDVRQLLDSEAHHHKVCPIGTGCLIAMVGVSSAENATTGTLSVLFGLVLGITPRTSKNKNEFPAARIHRQCNPKAIEVAFLTGPATEFFAEEQFQVLPERYLARGQGLCHTVPTDAALTTFLLKDMWMFGITKSTSELTAVAQTPECRYHLGLGINNVQVAVNGMDGDKRSHLLSLCGQLLKQVLTPCHIAIEASQWIRTTALSYAAEMDGHVLGTLCAVTMALLTNRLDLCIQGLFGAGKSKSMAILILALLELDVDHRLKILFLCKENSGTRSFADLLQWLDPPEAVLKRLWRLVGDQERNKSSYSYTIRHQPKRTKADARKVSTCHGYRWHS